MNLLRKLLFALAVTTCLLLPQGTASQAQAGHGHVQTRVYYLYYRGCVHCPWSYYGGSSNYNTVVYYARVLRYYGYEVFVR